MHITNSHVRTRMYFKTIVLAVAGCLAFSCQGSNTVDPVTTSDNSSGTGGSMARFTISEDHLYTIGNNNLQVYDIGDAAHPKEGVIMPVGFSMETIFPYGSNLFLGTPSGMYIYDISNPSRPKYRSMIAHLIQSCDPVVVHGTTAYVTLRSGTTCAHATNELDIIDISNIEYPQVIRQYPMFNPHGLGIDSTTLFICDGTDGVKMFDVSDPMNLYQTSHVDGVETYDAIPNQGLLMVTGPGGLYQYSYSANAGLTQLSVIPIKP